MKTDLKNRVAIPTPASSGNFSKPEPLPVPEKPLPEKKSEEPKVPRKFLKAGGVYCTNGSCRSPRSKVLDTVQQDGATIRHRECLDCGNRFKSVEK